MILKDESKKELINLACTIGRNQHFYAIELLKKFGTSKNAINKNHYQTFLADLRTSMIVHENTKAVKMIDNLIKEIK